MGKKKKTEKDMEDEDESEEEEMTEQKKNPSKEKKVKFASPVLTSINNKEIVDKYFKDRNKFHIYPDNENKFNGKYFTCKLTNTKKNSNKFYIIQLLEDDSQKKLVIFTRWGRIDSEGQKKIESVDKISGPKLFLKKYEDKIKGGYEEIFEEDNEEDKKEGENPLGVRNVEELIKEIVELFKKKTGKPCYIYEESIVNDLGILDDKMGGNPYLPIGIKYPKNSKGEDMALLLQVNLSKCKLDGFPQKGIFEIFHELDPGDGVNTEYKLFLFDENLEYQTKLPEIKYADSDFYISKPVKLTFKKGISYMNLEDNNFEPTALKCINEITKKKYNSCEEFCEQYNIDFYDDFQSKFEGDGFEENGLGVYPNFIQWDSREGKTQNYVNIFGFGSGENNFKDCCAAFILIDKNDLKKGNVEKGIFEYQQT